MENFKSSILHPPSSSRLRVAIVHDWFVGGGAERVVLELHKMFPDAPIYTSYCNDEWRAKLGGQVRTGYLQHWPFSSLRKFMPFLRIWWFSSLKFDGYNLVISSSGAEAKGLKVKKPTIHINYCHAPTHYYWSRYEDYLKSPGFGLLDSLARLGLKLLVGPLRRWDYQAAQRPDYMVANSNYTKEQIKKYYGRDSSVIHPPVDTERFRTAGHSKKLLDKSSNLDRAGQAIARHGLVTAGRQTPYKRIDLAVAACSQTSLPLTVLGTGPDHNKLIKMAGPTVTFVANASDEEVASYFSKAEAFIFPGLDDFGVVAVEAMAAGTPVIAYRAGGALDYIQPGKTGLFFEKQTTVSLAATIQKFLKSPKLDHADIAKQAEDFSPEIFRQKIQKLVASLRLTKE